MDVWGHQHLDGAEPEPHVQQRGDYTVALTATNPYGNNTNTKNNYITVGQPAGGELLRHADHRRAALGGNLHRQLDQLADGLVVDLRRHQHLDGSEPEPYLYSTGSYTVALTATNAYGNNTNTKNNYITVGNPPVANFSGTPTSGAAPLAVTFTDSSTNSPTAWSWNFGDSNTSTVQNPSHTYSGAGTFTVALTATNPYGNNTNTKSNYITVGQRAGGQLLRHADDGRLRWR